jgi:LPXTG-motif cell wall-anchored protein
MRRPILTAAAPACLLLGLTPLSASADVAPPGSASAAAARVSDLVQISGTEAKADEKNSEAKASVITIAGQPVPPGTASGGGVGGAESGEGENKGALIDTVDKSPVRVQVAPWEARATQKDAKGKRSSSASAALATVEVPDHAKVKLLTSDASAEHTDTKSTGSSTSDAADISVGPALHLVLLHSEVDSDAKGTSYLVGLNGSKIGTQEQLNELCSLDVAGVAALSCLKAAGGTANGITTGSAEVLGVSTTLGLSPASAFATTGTLASGTAPSILESVASAVPATEAPRAAAAPAAPAAELPRTGAAAASLAASGLAALLMGRVLRLFGRRRRSMAA